MLNLAKLGAAIGLLLLTVVSHGKEVIYHDIDPPYNPDYIGSTPDSNDANNYFYLRSAESPDRYSFDINSQYAPIMQDQYFYGDYGDWVAGDYDNRDTRNYGDW